MPASKQPWPNSAACWSPAMPAIGSWTSNRPGAVVPKIRLLPWTSGSMASGTSNSRHSSAVPALLADVVEHRPAGIGDVGRVDRAAGQPPQQEAVDRPESQLAALGPGAGSWHMVEHPGDLGRREIRVQNQARRRCHHGLRAVLLQPRAEFRRSAVLPDDRAMDWLAGRAVPDHRRLALVGDADSGDPRRIDAACSDRLADGRQHALPDLLRIMLDPARLRVMLAQLMLRRGDRPAFGIEQDRTG